MIGSKYKEPYSSNSDEEIARLARQLAQTREAKGLSQRDMADILGVSQSTISNFEAGRSQNRFKFVVAYTIALDLSVELIPTKNYYEGFK